MKKLIQRGMLLIAFVLIGMILFSGISEILSRKCGGSSDMIHSFYEIEENTLDVLCMGSSHGYSAFQPNTLWEEHGITSYVMCSPRQTVASTWYLLQEALTRQKPKVLLLETYYFFYGKKYADEAALRLAFDGIRLGKAKHEMIQDILANTSVKKKLSYYVPFLKYHSRWDDLSNSDFHSKTYLKGSIFDFDVYSMEEPELPLEGSKLPEVVSEYFEKIISLCQENDIKLILFTAPYGYANENEKNGYMKKQGINITLENDLAKRGIPYFNFQKTNEAGIDYSTDFRDYAHMNTRGAMKLTRVLGDSIAEACSLQDHRQDPAYQVWQEDYEKFQAAVNEANQ